MKRIAGALVIAFTSASCSGGGGGGGRGDPATIFGGDRPVELQIPSTYDESVDWPLLVVLHGYGVDAGLQTGYWQTGPLVDGEGVFILAPEGTVDSFGNQFWNATDACCAFDANPPDDVSYILELVDDVRGDYAIDPSRTFVSGHSNGGFMAHRMACDAPDVFGAAMSLAGATWSNAADCTPSEDISLLQVHGDQDADILYAGGSTAGFVYPGAVESVTRWQGYDACDAGLILDPVRKELDSSLPADETRVERFTCPGTLDVELWTIEGGGHIPAFDDFASAFWEWLDAHPKP